MKAGAVLFMASVMLCSGCLCCGNIPGLDKNGGGAETTETTLSSECTSPYIQVGGDCCMDSNGNDVCDSDEGQTQDEGQEIIITEETTTTISDVSTTLAPTTTLVGAKSAAYECVRSAGYNPDTWFYLYSKSGHGCGDDFLSTARTASSRRGLDPTFIDITVLEGKEIAAMQCFYGKYSTSNLEFTYCPRMLCPRTGGYDTLTGVSSQSVLSKMTGFIDKCR